MTKSEKQKVYLLIFKCAWSRHINIEITTSADTKNFLQAIQSHIYEYGIPSYVNSDSGTNLTAGYKWLKDNLDTVEVREYFDEMKISPPEFMQIPRGGLNRGLPGFIESSVKLVRRLLQGAIGNNVVPIMQLYAVVKQCICYANKRPLTNLSALRNQDVSSTYRILTPEVLKLGYETAVVDINLPNEESDWTPDQLKNNNIAFDNIDQLVKIKQRIRSFYHDEFLYSLMDQATRLKGKYLPVKHQKLSVGDICIIKDPFVKPNLMPLGTIESVHENSLGEIVSADIRKANKTIITRDSSDIVLLLRGEARGDNVSGMNDGGIDLLSMDNSNVPYRLHDKVDKNQRTAAINCKQKLKDYFQS